MTRIKLTYGFMSVVIKIMNNMRNSDEKKGFFMYYRDSVSSNYLIYDKHISEINIVQAKGLANPASYMNSDTSWTK